MSNIFLGSVAYQLCVLVLIFLVRVERSKLDNAKKLVFTKTSELFVSIIIDSVITIANLLYLRDEYGQVVLDKRVGVDDDLHMTIILL